MLSPDVFDEIAGAGEQAYDGPPVLTDRHAKVFIIIQGSPARPLSATDIGRRLELDPREAGAQVRRALDRLLELKLIRRIEKGRRDVTYESMSLEVPKFKIVARGRTPGKGTAIKRVFRGASTVLDTGEAHRNGILVDSGRATTPSPPAFPHHDGGCGLSDARRRVVA